MDVIECRGPAPSLVLPLVEALPDTSMTSALARGGIEHRGWGPERYMLADIYDAIALNTRVSGSWRKGKEPKFPPYPRPGDPDKKGSKKKSRTVASLFATLQRG